MLTEREQKMQRIEREWGDSYPVNFLLDLIKENAKEWAEFVEKEAQIHLSTIQQQREEIERIDQANIRLLNNNNQSRPAMIAALKHIEGTAQLFSHRDKTAVLSQLAEALKLLNYPLPEDIELKDSDSTATAQ